MLFSVYSGKSDDLTLTYWPYQCDLSTPVMTQLTQDTKKNKIIQAFYVQLIVQVAKGVQCNCDKAKSLLLNKNCKKLNVVVIPLKIEVTINTQTYTTVQYGVLL